MSEDYVGPSTPPQTPPPASRKSPRKTPATPDTPSRLHRFLPNLFPAVTDDWLSTAARARVADADSSSIDWAHEYAKERIRKQALSEIQGLRGFGARIWDATTPWLVVVATGMGTGMLAASLDILSVWLSDLRSGACQDTWWMSKATCCTGLDDGEICMAWRTWGERVGGNIVSRALAQYSVYMVCAVLFAVTASYFVNMYAPYAFHTGIPEIKALLGGYVIVNFLSGWTLLIKSLGLPLAVASGLSLGKEGPLVHVACCIGNLMLRPFAVLRGNEARQRELLSAAAAAGVSVAFGAPLGGVLFSLEEISTFFPGSTLWQAFVCAIVAAVTLQYIDPFNTGKLVLFQVTTSQVWRGFELIPWLFLGICGGVWGACFIRLNQEWERFRRGTGINKWPVTEVAALALFTAVVSYLIVFMRIPSAELVVNLFQDCSATDTYGLCDSNNVFTLVSLLLVTAFAKTLLTAVTFGASVPAGIFLPSLTIGACIGRSVGLVMSEIQKAHPGAWMFSNCPADGVCISPPVYAVIGAASALGGVTRMTISLVVILFELTGAIDLVLQIMMAVMVSKFTGDFFSRDGIYEAWINMRNYPFLNTKIDYRRDPILAKHVMTAASDIVSLTDEGWTVAQIAYLTTESLLDAEEYRGFPIVRTKRDQVILGYISRQELQSAVEKIRMAEEVTLDTLCFFSYNVARGTVIGPSNSEAAGHRSPAPSNPNTPRFGETPRLGGSALPKASEKGLETPFGDSRTPIDWVNLKSWADETPMTLSLETPMELVVQMFQRLGLRVVLLTFRGKLAGILTKMDLHAHLQPEPETVIRRIRRSTLTSAGIRQRLPPSLRGGLARSPLPPESPGSESGLLEAHSRRSSIAWGV